MLYNYYGNLCEGDTNMKKIISLLLIIIMLLSMVACDIGGNINPDNGTPYRTYYSFMMFNTLYSLGNQVSCEMNAKGVFASAAVDGKKAAVVISNTTPIPADITLEMAGFAATDVQFLRIDEENRYTLTGESLGGIITVPPYGTLEIKLFDV